MNILSGNYAQCCRTGIPVANMFIFSNDDSVNTFLPVIIESHLVFFVVILHIFLKGD